MKIILLLFGLATITYGLPVSQKSDFKDGILEEDTRSNLDSFKIEEQEQFVPKSNLSEISTTTTNEIKDDSFNIETSPQIWETASDKVESDNAAWKPRDQLSTTTTTEKKEVIDVSTSKFSTPARSENKEHFDKKSEENIEIITKPTPDEIDHNQSSTTAEASFVDSEANIGNDERSPAPAITEQTPINIEDKTEEEFITEISTSFQTSTAEPELTTTTIEPVYNEIDSATPISSTKPEEIDENYSSPQEVEQSTSISTTAEILQSETTTASEPKSNEIEYTTPAQQALSSITPEGDENSSSPQEVEQSTSISTTTEILQGETTTASEPESIETESTTPAQQALSSIKPEGDENSSGPQEVEQSSSISTKEEILENETTTTTTTTASEPESNEIESTTPPQQALSSIKPEGGENSSSPHEVEQSSSISTTEEILESETTTTPTTTTASEPESNEIESTTPPQQALSSIKPEGDENTSIPLEVELSTSMSGTKELIDSETTITTTASEPDSKETESTTPGSDQALSSTNPGNDSTSFEENSSSHHAVEQSTSISTSNENEVSETTIANLPNKNDNSSTTIKEEPNSETTTMSHQIAGQELPIRSSEENDSTTGSTFEEETEKVTMGPFTATSSEHDISEVDAVEDTTTERVEEEIQIGQEVVTKVSEVLEVVTEDSTNIIPNLRNGDENNTPDSDAIHASNQTTAQSESYPEESSATTLKEDSQTTTFSSSIDWETSPAKDLNSTEPEIFTDSGNYQPKIEQETEVPSIEEDSANNDVQSNVQEDHDGKENRDGNESNGGNDYNDGNASNGGKDYNDGNESNNGNDYNDGNESNGDKDYNDGNDSNGGKDSHDGNDYNDGNDTKDGNDYNDGNDSKDGNDYNDDNDEHGDNDKYDDNHAFQDNNKNKSDHKVINQVSGDNSNNKEDSETGLPMEQPKTGARVVNTVLVPSNNNQAQPDGHNFNHFFYNQFYPGVRSPFQTYPKVSIYPAWPPRYQSAQGSQHPLNFANNAFLNNFLVPSRQFSQQQKYSSL